MSIKVLGTPRVFVVLYKDGYNDETEIISCYSSKQKAQKVCRENNKVLKEDYSEDCFDENFDVDWDKTDGDSRYYQVVGMTLTM